MKKNVLGVFFPVQKYERVEGLCEVRSEAVFHTTFRLGQGSSVGFPLTNNSDKTSYWVSSESSSLAPSQSAPCINFRNSSSFNSSVFSPIGNTTTKIQLWLYTKAVTRRVRAKDETEKIDTSYFLKSHVFYSKQGVVSDYKLNDNPHPPIHLFMYILGSTRSTRS